MSDWKSDKDSFWSVQSLALGLNDITWIFSVIELTVSHCKIPVIFGCPKSIVQLLLTATRIALNNYV